MNLNFFKLSEFDSPDLPGSGEEMQVPFLMKLETARAIAKVPFIITSGYRTPSHNEAVGGTSDSSHLRGYAADIAATDNRTRYLILQGLIKAGFKRIGIGENFIHVDCDPYKTDKLIWTYY